MSALWIDYVAAYQASCLRLLDRCCNPDFRINPASQASCLSLLDRSFGSNFRINPAFQIFCLRTLVRSCTADVRIKPASQNSGLILEHRLPGQPSISGFLSGRTFRLDLLDLRAKTESQASCFRTLDRSCNPDFRINPASQASCLRLLFQSFSSDFRLKLAFQAFCLTTLDRSCTADVRIKPTSQSYGSILEQRLPDQPSISGLMSGTFGSIF